MADIFSTQALSLPEKKFKMVQEDPPTEVEWDNLADGKSNDIGLEKIWLLVTQEIFQLWQQRQKKYGRRNIAEFGEVGCLVRGYDKMARLRRALIDKEGEEMDDETVADSWLDLVNYAIMGLMCHRGLWK